MSGLDASFLYLETPSMHMHVCATVIFDPATAPGGYSFGRVRQLVESRLGRLPRFRKRLASVPLHLHHPVWVDDEDFDLDYHLRRIGCPTPGGIAELAVLTADIAGRPLDRTKPLWEMWVVEGLAEGRHGLIIKIHHACTDGVSGANLMLHLFDLTPDTPREEPPPWEPEHGPGDVQLVGYALANWARHPLRLARLLPATAKGAAGLVRVRRARKDGPGMPTPFTAPRVPFNGTITPHRAVAFVDVDLAGLKAVKRAFDTTVNDVVLAVCSGALRRWLASVGQMPESSLQAVVPISVHEASSNGHGVNKVSALFTSLATDFDDPVERLLRIAETNHNAKEEHQAVGAQMLREWAEFAAPATFSLAARLYSSSGFAARHPVVYNLIVSNVPGPAFPLYFCGGEIIGLYPLGPILEGIGLNLTVLSLRDKVGFGFISCRELLPDIGALASEVPAALEELTAAATAAAQRS
jgi:WS/DGAT/MGAT family acyltransferase